MFDSIVSHVDKCAGGIAQTEFFYAAAGVSQMGFFYADGAVSCVQLFTDAGEKLHKLRQPVHVKNPV